MGQFKCQSVCFTLLLQFFQPSFRRASFLILVEWRCNVKIAGRPSENALIQRFHDPSLCFSFSLTTLVSFFPPLRSCDTCRDPGNSVGKRDDWLRQSERIVDPDAKGITNPRIVHEKPVKNPTSEPEV
jgi:hypothetical protein